MCFIARSLKNKLDELKLYTDQEKPDLINITETWLKDEISNAELNVNDYVFFRQDKITNMTHNACDVR